MFVNFKNIYEIGNINKYGKHSWIKKIMDLKTVIEWKKEKKTGKIGEKQRKKIEKKRRKPVEKNENESKYY